MLRSGSRQRTTLADGQETWYVGADSGKRNKDIIRLLADFETFSGKTAALSITGKPKPVSSVPFFWSTMFGKSLRYAGEYSGRDCK